jgi:hypothetical protein
VGVEWLSIGATDHSCINAEARQIRVAVTWKCGGLELCQRGGAAGQRCGGDAESRRVGVAATTRRHSGSQAGGDLEVRSVWTPAVIDLNPITGLVLEKWQTRYCFGRADWSPVAWFGPLVAWCLIGSITLYDEYRRYIYIYMN